MSDKRIRCINRKGKVVWVSEKTLSVMVARKGLIVQPEEPEASQPQASSPTATQKTEVRTVEATTTPEATKTVDIGGLTIAGNDVTNVPEVKEVKKKRTRRTKAQIEADKNK